MSLDAYVCKLFIILGSQCNFLCELEINNQNNPI